MDAQWYYVMNPEARRKVKQRLADLSPEEQEWIERAGRAFAHFIETGEFSFPESQTVQDLQHHPVTGERLYREFGEDGADTEPDVPTEIPEDRDCYSWDRDHRMRCGSMRCPLKSKCATEAFEEVKRNDQRKARKCL